MKKPEIKNYNPSAKRKKIMKLKFNSLDKTKYNAIIDT